jgi:SNF2 family DNA or RNA helicase
MKSTTPEWVLDGSRLRLRTASGTLVDVSATDVVAVEFKGRTSVQGQTISSQPSEAITDIEFNRFPLEPWLVLRAPAAGQGARCSIVLRNRDGNIDVDSFQRDCDQAIAENAWYPVATSLFTDIDQLLSKSNSAIGPITLKQYLILARSESPRVIFEEASEAIVPTPPVEVITPAHQFKGTLYPYQIAGVRWIGVLANEELGGILGDEMGLGKTVQVIAALTEDSTARPNLIVAPATLLENWRREFVKFAPGMKVAVHRGGGRTGFPSALRAHDVVITSYDTAVRDLALLKMVEWHFVILDEAQAIKNAETRRARAVREIPKRTGLAVTGTPVENRLEDLWSILDFACPDILGPLGAFRNRFENTVAGATALQPAVSPLLLRRRVAEVAADLPERINTPVAIEMPGLEATEYERLRQAIVDEYGAAATLVALTKLREFCTHPFVLDPMDDDPAAHSAKYVRLIEILDEIVAARDKVILFTSFQRMIDLAVRDVEKRFGMPCFWIDGRTPVDNRQDIVDRFSDIGGSALLVLNPRAAGTGLNIVAANHVIHYNLEWNPAVEDQASARAHRRGQQRPVTVHRLFYASTVEEIIDKRVSLKRQLAAAAVVGTAGAEDLSDVAAALRISPVLEPEA